MKKGFLLVVVAVFCLLCAVSAGCIFPNAPGVIPPTQIPLGPGPVVDVVPGEWHGILVNNGSQVEYDLDCMYGGSAKLEVESKTGATTTDRTYHGTWSQTVTASYTIEFASLGTYQFVMNNDGSGTLTTPDGVSVTMWPEDGNPAAYDPVTGDWKGSVVKNDSTRISYDLEFLRSGSVKVSVETTSPLSFETEVEYVGTWTKSADNLYAVAIPGHAGYTMELSSSTAATLSTPRDGNVRLTRDY